MRVEPSLYRWLSDGALADVRVGFPLPLRHRSGALVACLDEWTFYRGTGLQFATRTEDPDYTVLYVEAILYPVHLAASFCDWGLTSGEPSGVIELLRASNIAFQIVKKVHSHDLVIRTSCGVRLAFGDNVVIADQGSL